MLLCKIVIYLKWMAEKIWLSRLNQERVDDMITLKGIGGSRGYAVGTAVIKQSASLEVPMHTISDVSVEIARFKAAQESYDKKLIELGERTAHELDKASSEIFGAYRSILHDDIFFGKAFDRVEKERLNIECVVWEECRTVCKLFEGFEDSYLRERGTDIENVCNELIRIMMGLSSNISDEFDGIDDIILIAEELEPTEAVRIDKARLRGIVTVNGGVTSHTVILAKALGIPAIVGVHDALSVIKQNSRVMLDAVNGEVTLEADSNYLHKFQDAMKHRAELSERYDKAVRGECKTLDGFAVAVNINTGDEQSMLAFSCEECDGIGLLRTEFLYMSASDYPGEKAQLEIYSDLARRAGGREVIIRTLDIGGDKQAYYMNLPKEDNPFLGYRAIRISLDRREVFITQLRAILRAAVYGDVKLMFPMIVKLEELLEAKELVAEAARQLETEGLAYRLCQIGIMIETPAAAIISDVLAAHCDFFSVGSNDLIQYVTATDRMNRRVQYLYDSHNISVLRLIRQTAQSAAAAGIPWGICGEIASEDALIPLWVALGASELSVTPPQVGRVKYLIRRINRAEFLPALAPVFETGNIGEIRKLLLDVLAGLDA